MAKKRKSPNKSQAIRDYYKSHPNAKPKQVVAALKKKRITVDGQFVSTIRSVSKKKGGKVGRPGRPVGGGRRQSRPSSNDVSFDSLLKVKQIVDELGGIGQARLALSALEQLVD